jgi:hypothetical protein
VPQGGPISVTTLGGTGTSTAVFVVQHARSVWLSVGQRASGDVTVTDGFAACGASVPVKIQHFDKGHGKWKTVASVLTKADGGYSARGVEESGRYRAIAKRVKLGSGDMCVKGLSPIAKK